MATPSSSERCLLMDTYCWGAVLSLMTMMNISSRIQQKPIFSIRFYQSNIIVCHLLYKNGRVKNDFAVFISVIL